MPRPLRISVTPCTACTRCTASESWTCALPLSVSMLLFGEILSTGCERRLYMKGDVDGPLRSKLMSDTEVNFDRNQGNLLLGCPLKSACARLVRSVAGRRSLVPIDHGCSLPDHLGFPLHDVAWACWPQSKAMQRSS